MYTMPLWHCTIAKGHYIINHNTVLEYCIIPHNAALYCTETVLYHTANSKSQTLKLYSFEDQIFRQLKIEFTTKVENLQNAIQSQS